MSQERARHHITTSGVRVPSYMHIFRNDSYVRPKVDGWSWLGGWFGGKGCVSVVCGGREGNGEQTGPSAHAGICHTYLTKCVTCRGGVVGGVGWEGWWKKRVTSSTALCLNLFHICLSLFHPHAADFKLKLV